MHDVYALRPPRDRPHHHCDLCRWVLALAQSSLTCAWGRAVSDEDYRQLVKNALDALKELMKSEFAAVKVSQVEGYRFSQEQLDHVYEVIKIISKKLDDSSLSMGSTINTLRADINLTAKTLSDSVSRQIEFVNERFGRLESMQAKLWGGVGVVGFITPVAVGIILYVVEHVGVK